ncbi:MAG: serine protein kinase PrkA, partial [Candidatus Nanohaloarchaea archaeon]|nr:serine protein kinase PrkA [Candidatus Nanohaloarchaea archaeon]
EPDENFLREIEEHLNQPEDRKEDFRNTISNWYGKTSFRDGSVEPVDNDKLRRAIESRLWEQKKHSIDFNALVTDTGEGIEDGDRRSQWIDNLTEMGYSEEGAEELITEVGAEVAKEEMGS